MPPSPADAEVQKMIAIPLPGFAVTMAVKVGMRDVLALDCLNTGVLAPGARFGSRVGTRFRAADQRGRKER